MKRDICHLTADWLPLQNSSWMTVDVVDMTIEKIYNMILLKLLVMFKD